MDTGLFGRTILWFGVLLVIVGAALIFLPKIPFLGRLPGDIAWQNSSGNFKIYAPIMTSILLSIVLTILLNLFMWRR